MVDLTIIILTRNEEKNLEKCISSLRGVAKRVIVVDSYSTDNTVELAKSLGAEVVLNPFENHAVQFNWALANVQIDTEWVMRLDADEELTCELAIEIDSRLDKLPHEVNGIILRRRVYFMDKWLRHGGKYPERLLRIFRFGHGTSELKMMDEHLIVTDGKIVTFKYDFCDNNNKGLEWWIEKHNWYSDKEVLERQMRLNNVISEHSLYNTKAPIYTKVKRFVKNNIYYNLPKFWRAHFYYIYRYYFRLGFLDGVEGKIYTFLQAYWYRFIVDAKLYECDKKSIDIDVKRNLKS